jgi:indoleamine 2,3-dioxygenase
MPARISEFSHSENEGFNDPRSLISKNGFLPVKQPLKVLPDEYYQPWERIIAKLPVLLREKTIRNGIDNLEILRTVRLTTEAEWQRAYVILCFLSHGYIWGDDVPSEVSIFPPNPRK